MFFIEYCEFLVLEKIPKISNNVSNTLLNNQKKEQINEKVEIFTKKTLLKIAYNHCQGCKLN